MMRAIRAGRCGPRRSIPLLAVLVLAVGAPVGSPASAADWLQYGSDASRTGASAGEGPAIDEVAMRFQLPVPASNYADPVRREELKPSPPLIIGTYAYVMLQGTTWTSAAARVPDTYRTHVVRVDMTTAEASTIIVRNNGPSSPVSRYSAHLASDGELLYFVGERLVEAFHLEGGDPVWQAALHGPTGETGSTGTRWFGCAPPALENGRLYVACREAAFADSLITVWALDLERHGEILWTWTKDLGPLGTWPGQPGSFSGQDPTLWLFAPWKSTSTDNPWIGGLSVISGSVVVTTIETNFDALGDGGDMAPTRRPSVWFLGATSGALEMSDGTMLEDSIALGARATAGGASFNVPPAPVGDQRFAFVEMTALWRWERGADGWMLTSVKDFRQGTGFEGDPGSGMALSGGTIFVTSIDAIYRMDVDTNNQADFHLPIGETWDAGGLILADDVLFAVARTTPKDRVLYAINANTMERLWSTPLGTLSLVSVANGLLVAVDRDGMLTVFGVTDASLRVGVEGARRTPQPGDVVRVDLAGTEAGVFGPATEFRADWGDGTVTEWTNSPIFEHRYVASQDVTARFWARNANQSASTTVEFLVGRPPELNALQRAFSDENQDTTWGLIGVFLTLGGVMVGLAAVARKRHLLERELEAVEAAFSQTRDRPRECEAVLVERRARARGFLVDGKLNEGQAAILLARIDELHRTLRLTVIDERLAFLPYGMVQQLQSMLADGQLTEWEHHHFRDALARDRLLTPAQRKQVAGVIDDWFAADSGRSLAVRSDAGTG